MLIVPSGLSYGLLKITRELTCSSAVRVDFAHDNIQKHYPLARANATGSSNAVHHTFLLPCGAHNQERESGTAAWLCTQSSVHTHRRILPPLAWSRVQSWFAGLNQNSLIGLPARFLSIIASNSNPYYSHTIPRLPPKELFFSASELLTQQFKHVDTLRLVVLLHYSSSAICTEYLHRKRHTAVPFWVSWTTLRNELEQPYNWMLCSEL